MEIFYAFGTRINKHFPQKQLCILDKKSGLYHSNLDKFDLFIQLPSNVKNLKLPCKLVCGVFLSGDES